MDLLIEAAELLAQGDTNLRLGIIERSTPGAPPAAVRSPTPAPGDFRASADRKHMHQRPAKLDEELRQEPAQVESLYDVSLERLQPVGLIVLWPKVRSWAASDRDVGSHATSTTHLLP